MKALSIRQPYAFAIIHGTKRIENRSWATKFRGEFLIHAGLKSEKAEAYGVIKQIADETGKSFDELSRLYKKVAYRGGIVGSANLVDCVQESDSGWFFGPYGLQLEDVKEVEPMKYKGQLGFFEVAYPA